MDRNTPRGEYDFCMVAEPGRTSGQGDDAIMNRGRSATTGPRTTSEPNAKPKENQYGSTTGQADHHEPPTETNYQGEMGDDIPSTNRKGDHGSKADELNAEDNPGSYAKARNGDTDGDDQQLSQPTQIQPAEARGSHQTTNHDGSADGSRKENNGTYV